MQDMQVCSQKVTLEKEMATHCNILAWRIPWMEESDGLQSIGAAKIRHNLATKPKQPLLEMLTVITRFK